MQKIFFSLLILFLFALNPVSLFALDAGEICTNNRTGCNPGLDCIPTADPNFYICDVPGAGITPKTGDVFGKIQPPDALKGLVAKDPSGTGGLSTFFSNLIALFYSIAAIVLVFMLVWGAWDWLISGGEKEKIEGARNKIIYAIIGIILFAVAFAIIQILGQFTGFTFFTPAGP